ncbi:glycerophosphodiester phosphodiesterase [Saliphagus sp. LR7]|uniref:glycerophosphodiester phosphodiesterase n=1 Tax=Saliphagus sp. LR7 TaxID=2282654 RepID=UPI000DF7EABC|nr:glycerophosphodiester phosphodiesterase [Saliphagus sp. LR7]
MRKRATDALVAGVLAAGLAVLAGIRARSLTTFAHRGFAADAPENTVPAVRGAADRADGVEIDVRRCASGELVCVHDADVERFTGDPIPVGETEWTALREIEVGDGATVPRLEDVLDAVPDDVLLNVELKERGLAADALAAVAGRERVLLSAFDPEVLEEVRAADGGDEVALAYVTRSSRGTCSVADRFDCVAVHPRADLPFRSAIVPRAHRRGLAVNAWTVDSRLEMLALALVGVDGVFADSARCLGRSRR